MGEWAAGLLPLAAGVLVGIAVPLAVQFPAAAPYITVIAGGIAFLAGKLYPGWNEGWFTRKA